MIRFELQKSFLDGVHLLKRVAITDQRGSLERLYCSEELRCFTNDLPVVQINTTLTIARGCTRGMHYQVPPFDELKIITCTSGKVFDVVVDIRRGSPTFLQHFCTILDSEKQNTLVVPSGFAHGFQSLIDRCQMLYFHTKKYSASHEAGLNCLDPSLNIDWPLEVSSRSDRDAGFPNISSEFNGVLV